MVAKSTQLPETQPKREASSLSKDGKWRSFARVPNLLQYASSGPYYARVKISGKTIRRGLDADVFSTAKLRLIGFLKEQSDQQPEGRTLTFSQAVDLYGTRKGQSFDQGKQQTLSRHLHY